MPDPTSALDAAKSALDAYRNTPGHDPKAWAIAAVPMAYALRDLITALEE